MLKDVAGTCGLKVLSMYVRTFGYGMSTVVEMKGPTDTFATVVSSKNVEIPLDSLTSFCSVILSHRSSSGQKASRSKRPERTVIRSSPRRSHQSNGGVENYQKQLQGQVRTMLAAMQERTRYRPIAGQRLDEIECSTCSLAHSPFPR